MLTGPATSPQHAYRASPPKTPTYLHIIVAVEGHRGECRVVAQAPQDHRVLALVGLRHLHLAAQRLQQAGQVLCTTQALITQRLQHTVASHSSLHGTLHVPVCLYSVHTQREAQRN